MKNLLLLSILFFTGISAIGQTTATKASGNVFSYVEKMPVYPNIIQQYIEANLHYPEAARKNKVQGRVILRFVVTDTGSVTDVVVTKGIGSGCDEEAVRLVQGMDKWQPGMQDGKRVNAYYNLPVVFTLEEETPKQNEKK